MLMPLATNCHDPGYQTSNGGAAEDNCSSWFLGLVPLSSNWGGYDFSEVYWGAPAEIGLPYKK